MRPLALEVEGFTSFRDRVALDFSGLDLFAVTGPTGAGKSSLIDAIVFALYGQVPRVGDDYKQLISHGAERLSVLFAFEAGPARYRVARAVRRAGTGQQRLERQGAGGWEPLADRAREIRARIEEILGLDYDGFTRSVVLPQGQFDAFLKGEPKERRKILVALLNLGVYDEVQKLANQKGALARQEAAFIGQQLAQDYAEATPETLAARKNELAAAESEAQATEAALAALARGLAFAQKARSARCDREALSREAAQEEEARKAAEAALAGAGEERALLEAERALVVERIAATAYDEERLAVLAAACPRAEQLVGLAGTLERLEREQEARRRSLEAATEALAAAETAVPAAEATRAEADRAVAAARGARDAAHREHAALALRRELKPGEACPVCAQKVTSVPGGAAPALDRVEAALRDAEKAARAAADAEQRARLALQKAQGDSAALRREAAQAEERRAEVVRDREAAFAALRAAGVTAEDLGEPARVLARVKGEIGTLEAARRAKAELEEKRTAAERALSRLDTRLAGAAATRDAARARLEAIGARQAGAAGALDDALAALRALAREEAWPGLDPLPGGRDEVQVVESLQGARLDRAKALAARVATLGKDKALVEERIARAGELRGRKETLEAQGALLKALADHLRANELVAWIQEEALRRLAEDGSGHLARLSQGRYELRLGSGEAAEAHARADQDFFVVDHWNADSVRSVKTLSGGETFLASLALALALAGSLAQLSTGGRAGEVLESLFLDEGFGTLDAETLEVVVSALDALHGGQRTVGIVTHVRELAERLPARLEVRRQGSTSVATVV